MSLFWIFSRQNFYQQSAYRLNFWLEIAGILLQIYVVYKLWNVLFDQTPQSFAGITLPQMITYAVLGMLIGSILNTSEGVHTYIQQQVRMGQITTDLMKPVDFIMHMMARDFGSMITRLVFFLVPPMVISYLLFDMVVPTSPLRILAFLLAVAQAWMILFFCNFMFGLISFKTLDLMGFSFTYFALVRFASGQIVPLWMYPDVLQPVLNFLPFKSVFYTPLAIYNGVLGNSALPSALLTQTVWMVGLFVVARLIWSRIHNSLIVQGG